MIENVKKTTVIFTNHSINFSIVKQITLNNKNIDKLNLRFVQISAYLSQFNIDVRYKIDKINIVFDALSRLSSNNFTRDSEIMNTFDIDNYHIEIENISIFNYAFQKFLIAMTTDFKFRLIQKYFKKKS